MITVDYGNVKLYSNFKNTANLLSIIYPSAFLLSTEF
jgi:hypothetical protein